jgi:hypothetical protein
MRVVRLRSFVDLGLHGFFSGSSGATFHAFGNDLASGVDSTLHPCDVASVVNLVACANI